jgi:hypothetical protein
MISVIGLVLGTNLLPAVADDAALAKDSPTATPLAIQQNIVALPTLRIPAGGKAVFTLDATDREAMPEVLLRLEAFIPFGQDAGHPCIESHDGQLWLTDSKLVLLKLDPTNGKLIWKRAEPLAGWPFPSPRAYMGIPDTTIHDGKLWIMYNAQATRNPEGYAKGVQVGDRFVCVFKCSSPYFEKHGYQYHGIALSSFRPGSEKPVQTTMYVTDRKYNSSPDVALHDGSVFVVYNKFERLYGQSDNPAVNYDDFIGGLLPVEPE